MSIAVQSRFREVEKLVVVAQGKGLDDETASYFCKLGCVMICGAIERSVEILITDRVAARSAPQVASFFKSFFRRGTNYDCDAIQKVLFKLDKGWGHAFEDFIGINEQVRSDISSCYAMRNSIAHGGTPSLGPKILKQYFDSAFTLVAELDKLLRT